MPGKLTILLLLLFAGVLKSAARDALISGGMLYNKLSEHPVTVNPSTVIFYRHLNTSQIADGVRLSANYLNQYQQLCDKLNRRIYTDDRKMAEKDFIILPEKDEVVDAEQYCISAGFKLPEIRTVQQMLYIFNLMTLEGIKMIKAGIKRNDNTKFVFMSDLRDISEKEFSKVFPSIVTRYYDSANFHKEWYASDDAKMGYMFVYRLGKKGLELALVDPGQHQATKDMIVCQRGSDFEPAKRIESSILTKIAAHSCIRDMRSLIGTHELVAKEVNLFRKTDGKNQFPEVKLTLHPSLFEGERQAPKTTLYSLDVRKVCDPLFLDECKINFMDWLDRLFEMSKQLAVETKIEPSIIRVFVVHLILGSMKLDTTAPPTFEGCKINPPPVTKKDSYTAYLVNALALLKDDCPTFIPKDTVTWISRTLLVNQYNKDVLARLVNEYKIMSDFPKPKSKRSVEPYMTYEIDNKLEALNATVNWFGFDIDISAIFNGPIVYRGRRTDFRRKRQAIFSPLFAHVKDTTYKVLSKVFPPKLRESFDAWLDNLKAKISRSKRSTPVNWLKITNSELNKVKAKFLRSKRSSHLDRVNYENFNLSRNKRFTPLGALGAVMAFNGATSLAQGDAPLSWFGNVIGATMGLVTRQDLKFSFDELKQHSVALTNLTLNQHELELAYVSLAKDLDRVDSATHAVELSTATLISEYDNKMILRNLHDTIQVTLLKISQAMTNALNKHTSPYVLSPAELYDLSVKYRESNIQLSSNIKDVMTSVIVEHNEIIFLFEVPVYNDRTLFNLYSVKPLPLYDEGKSLTPINDISFFGISVTNNEYTVLSREEQNACQTEQFCRVSDVLRRLEETPHCVIKSFSKNVLACEMKETSDILGFYELHGQKLVYSVPDKQNIKLICRNITTQQHIHTDVTVSGVGLASIAPDCQVILPNDRRIFSNPAPLHETLGKVNFMDVFNYLPELDNFTTEIRDQSIFNHTAFVQLHMREVDTTFHGVDQVFKETFSFREFFPEFLRVLIGMLCVIFLLLLPCFCSYKYRTWFKTWILWKNPYKWLTEIRKIDLSSWTRRGSKFYKAAKDVEKNNDIIKRVLKSDEYVIPEKPHFADPITRVCNDRVNGRFKDPNFNQAPFRQNQVVEIDLHSLPPNLFSDPNRFSSPDHPDATSPTLPKSVKFPAPKPPLYPQVIVPCPSTQPLITVPKITYEAPPKVEKVETTLTKAALELQPLAERSVITQTSMRNTPEPRKRLLVRSRSQSPVFEETNCLAEAMKAHNISTINVSNIGTKNASN